MRQIKLPLQLLLVVPFLFILILSASGLMWLAYQSEKSSIQLMVDQLVSVSNTRVSQFLTAYFEAPVKTVQNNALLMRQGQFVEQALFDAPEKYLLAQNKLYRVFDDIYYSAANGAITGIDGIGDDKYEAKITTDFPKRAFYAIAEDGSRKEVVRENNYDSRTRDWFKNAVANEKAVWGNIYVLKNKNQLGLTAAEKVLNKDGELQGVWGINITLKTLTEFLQKLLISPNSLVYLVDKQGFLASSSTDQVLFSQDPTSQKVVRISATEAIHPVISGSSAFLLTQFKTFSSALGVSNVSARIAGEDYWLSVNQFSDDYGLDFAIVTVIHQGDFMGYVDALVQQFVLVFVIVVIFSIVIGWWMGYKVSRPIKLFSLGARNIAQGNIGDKVNVHSLAFEISSLESSFNQMSADLKHSFDQVQAMNQSLEQKVEARTQSLEKSNKALIESQEVLAVTHKQIRDSIEYGSMIQHTLLPDHDLFHDYFAEHFVYWQPKDTVGGDIYFLDLLRHDGECFLMMIDCTGHGVPGAFVTMLVKAIERQLVARLMSGDELISPADLLSVFNRSMKHLLKQDDLKTTANAGFDGCIVYLNKQEGKIIFSGAETSLFYRTNTQELTEIKGNRHSVGYRQSDSDYVFTDHTLTIESGLQIYLTTDGYVDQNGGEKGFPLGKKRFLKVAESCQSLPLNEQKAVFEAALLDYQGGHDRNDDVTVLSMRF